MMNADGTRKGDKAAAFDAELKYGNSEDLSLAEK